jgi:ABC-type transport system substrate-binding protein
VERGILDTVLDFPTPLDVVDRYRAEPKLRSRLEVEEAGVVRFLTFNLAQPPFDDVHVRKAVNLVVDKAGILAVFDKANRPEAIYDHLAPDRQENNLLVSYDPYATPDHAGDVAEARREMSLSPYDRDHDGTCDAPSCTLSEFWRDDPGFPATAGIVRSNLAEIGINLTAKLGDSYAMYSACGDPSKQATLCQVGWAGDYPSASTYFPPLYGSDALSGGYNFSLTGATGKDLARWGYAVRSVPNLDARMNDCATKLEADQVECWAAFDQYLMEVVVPAVPLLTDAYPWIFSARVTRFSWTPVTGTPALDNIALKPSP